MGSLSWAAVSTDPRLLFTPETLPVTSHPVLPCSTPADNLGSRPECVDRQPQTWREEQTVLARSPRTASPGLVPAGARVTVCPDEVVAPTPGRGTSGCVGSSPTAHSAPMSRTQLSVHGAPPPGTCPGGAMLVSRRVLVPHGSGRLVLGRPFPFLWSRLCRAGSCKWLWGHCLREAWR